jgi:hypothetical protein
LYQVEGSFCLLGDQMWLGRLKHYPMGPLAYSTFVWGNESCVEITEESEVLYICIIILYIYIYIYIF